MQLRAPVQLAVCLGFFSEKARVSEKMRCHAISKSKSGAGNSMCACVTAEKQNRDRGLTEGNVCLFDFAKTLEGASGY